MSEHDTASTTDVLPANERLNATTLNERPDEYVNRVTDDCCGRHSDSDEHPTCGRTVRENQFVRIETHQRTIPVLTTLSDERLGRLEAESDVQTTEWVREYAAETEQHCPVHGLAPSTL